MGIRQGLSVCLIVAITGLSGCVTPGYERYFVPEIFNLPATVERRPPNQYADMIEVFCRKFSKRENILVSLHAHNDQGMAVAATELALLAGADRVEGTLFGHGERTGNVDIVTIANNLASRGIETGLDFGKMDRVAATVERLTGMPVYYRQPYSGELVFTAFSGSHQDAIRKGMNRREDAAEIFGSSWKVPYLLVDPADMGREYQDLIRINSQSGKGGVAWVLEQDHDLHIPKAMQPRISAVVQKYSDQSGKELDSARVMEIFKSEFMEPKVTYRLKNYWPRPDEDNPTWIRGEAVIEYNGEDRSLTAEGDGPVDAFANCIRNMGIDFTIEDYDSHAIDHGSSARAIAYVPLQFGSDVIYGVGCDTNIDQAAIRAVMSGLNRWALKNS